MLMKAAMAEQAESSKQMLQMFDDGKSIQIALFSVMKQIFVKWLINKQNFRFWGSENPHVALSKPLHLLKVTVWAAVSSKGIYWWFPEGTVTGKSYQQLLEKPFSSWEKKGSVKNYYFMQDGATPARTHNVVQSLFKV